MRASDKKTTPWNLPVQEFAAWKRRMEEERLANDPNLTPEEVASRLAKVGARAAGDDFALGILDVLDRPARSLAGGGATPVEMGSSDAMPPGERKAMSDFRTVRDVLSDKVSKQEFADSMKDRYDELPLYRDTGRWRFPVSLRDIMNRDPQVDSRFTGVDLANRGPDITEGIAEPQYEVPGSATGYARQEFQRIVETSPRGAPVPDNGTRYLFAERDIAQQKLDNALRNLGIKQQLANLVSWSKSSSSGSRRDPRAALAAVAGVLSTADQFDAARDEAAGRALAAAIKQRQEDDQRIVRLKGMNYYIPIGTNEELTQMRALSDSAVELESLVGELAKIEKDKTALNYKELRAGVREQALAILSKANSQGVIQEAEFKRYSEMYPVDATDRVYETLGRNLQALANSLKGRAEVRIKNHNGRAVGPVRKLWPTHFRKTRGPSPTSRILRRVSCTAP